MIPIRKATKRKTNTTFLHYRKPVVVELLPGDVIRLRLYGQREASAVSIEITQLYYELVRRRVAARKLERQKTKQQKRKKYGRPNRSK
jgi:hypothetical protein